MSPPPSCSKVRTAARGVAGMNGSPGDSEVRGRRLGDDPRWRA